MCTESYITEEYEAYEMSLKRQRDSYSIIATAREEGAEKEKYRTARAMKADGEPFDKISRYTGLSTEEIATL